MKRLKLTAPLQSRDGTLSKGAKMKNVLAEKHGDAFKAMKRPGLSQLLAGSVLVGQGGIFVAGFMYVVSGDVLRKITVSPPSAGTTWAL